jgi:hypothetical protein
LKTKTEQNQKTLNRTIKNKNETKQTPKQNKNNKKTEANPPKKTIKRKISKITVSIVNMTPFIQNNCICKCFYAQRWREMDGWMDG